MKTKYSNSTKITTDYYSELSIIKIFNLYKKLKSKIPFSFRQCTFTYRLNNVVISCDVNNIPKNILISSTDYIIFDFISDDENSASVTLSPNLITVQAVTPFDYQNTKAFVEELINLTNHLFTNSNNHTCSTKNNKSKHVKHTHNKPFYRSELFWAVVGVILATVVGIVDIILGIIF